ncbi:hypothetical protein SAMN04487948_102428 [Halogranum amylolyticum]|uniref:Uncharacterized protein n=1 Tax=Halogranum amylolyticum TaxID=660520 RepID=A0A1H8PQP1_9EURY|nr:hypothetical protein [Halogranum amylolyticum]SEO43994.1 hypothetical protein SAMN04487948_102428 [Halogranum amylolyticum]
MAEFNDHVLAEAGDRGEKLLVDDLVLLIERHDGGTGPGVAVDRVEAYAEKLAAQDAPVKPEKVGPAIEERRIDSYRWAADATTSGTWFGSGTLYDVGDGRVSVLPAYWHDELAGETDLTRYLELIAADLDDSREFDSGGPDTGVPETLLVNAASVLSDLRWREARARLADLREEGVVAESADQHPNARVHLDDE